MPVRHPFFGGLCTLALGSCVAIQAPSAIADPALLVGADLDGIVFTITDPLSGATAAVPTQRNYDAHGIDGQAATGAWSASGAGVLPADFAHGTAQIANRADAIALSGTNPDTGFHQQHLAEALLIGIPQPDGALGFDGLVLEPGQTIAFSAVLHLEATGDSSAVFSLFGDTTAQPRASVWGLGTNVAGDGSGLPQTVDLPIALRYTAGTAPETFSFGAYLYADGVQAGTTPVPEPRSAALAAAGLVAVLRVVRRRRT